MMDLLFQLALSNVFISIVLAFAALVAEKTTRRPALTHVLWLLVFVKLVTPPVATFSFVLPEGSGPVSVTTAPLVENKLPAKNASDVALAGKFSDHNQETALLAENANVANASVSKAASSPSPVQPAAVAAPSDSQPLLDYGTLLLLLALLWFAGSCVMLGWSLRRGWLFNQLLQGCTRTAPQRVQQQAKAIAEWLNLTHIPEIQTTGANISPMVWCFGRKVQIIVPEKLSLEMRRDQFQWVLAHELAHVKRRDHLVRWIEWLCCVLFWWNPVMWWARKHLRSNEELSCDSLVISSFHSSPNNYAASLLAAVEQLATPAHRPPAMASEVNSGGHLERRLKMIISGKMKRTTSRVFRVAMLLGCAIVLPLGLAYGEDKDKPSEFDIIVHKVKEAAHKGQLPREDAGAIIKQAKKLEVSRDILFEVFQGHISRDEAKERWEGFLQEMKEREHRHHRHHRDHHEGHHRDHHEGHHESHHRDHHKEGHHGTEWIGKVAGGIFRPVFEKKMGEGEAWEKWEGFKKGVGAKLAQKAKAGDIPREHVGEVWETIKRTEVGVKMRLAVANGELSPEEARAKAREILGDKPKCDKKSECDRPEGGEDLRVLIQKSGTGWVFGMTGHFHKLVKAEKMPEEKAWEIYEKIKHKKVGPQIRKAVEEKKLSPEEGRKLFEALDGLVKRHVASLEKRDEERSDDEGDKEEKKRFDHKDVMKRAGVEWIGEKAKFFAGAVKKGEMTKEKAWSSWDAMKENHVAPQLKKAVAEKRITGQEGRQLWEGMEKIEKAIKARQGIVDGKQSEKPEVDYDYGELMKKAGTDWLYNKIGHFYNQVKGEKMTVEESLKAYGEIKKNALGPQIKRAVEEKRLTEKEGWALWFALDKIAENHVNWLKSKEK